MENKLLVDSILILFLCAASIELFIRANLQGILINIYSITIRVRNIIASSKVSDHWKEKAIPRYAIRLLLSSLKLIVVFSLVLIFFYLIGLFSSTFISTAISINGIIISLILSSFYILVRQKFI